MKPITAACPGYAPAWVLREDGVRARPSSSYEILLGAQQEWGALLCEPPFAWHHPLISEWMDASGRSRGSVSFPAVLEYP
eukprot:9159220-Heterocapsa_arctica.AAC.1